MTVREHELKAHRFRIDEQRQKLRDLNELKRQILATLDRLTGSDTVVAVPGGTETVPERRKTLGKSLEEIEAKVRQTEDELKTSQRILDEQENVRDGYDRVPVAVGSRRGRGQVEHIRIVRTHRH